VALRGNGDAITVQTFDGSGWVTVGAPSFVAGERLSLAVSRSDQPYLLLCDRAVGGRPTVLRFVGGSWGVVGKHGIIDWPGARNTLVFDSRDNPYVLFHNAQWHGNEVTGNFVAVKTFDGSQWTDVGIQEFRGYVGTLACGPDDSLFLAYSDFSPGNRPVVVKMMPNLPPR
jgi:hypothetical protein